MECLDSKQKQSLSVLSLGSIMWLDVKWMRLLQISWHPSAFLWCTEAQLVMPGGCLFMSDVVHILITYHSEHIRRQKLSWCKDLQGASLGGGACCYIFDNTWETLKTRWRFDKSQIKEKIVGELVGNSHCKMTMRNKAGAAQEWRGSKNAGILESTHQSSDDGA